jgi:hypothetical protein
MERKNGNIERKGGQSSEQGVSISLHKTHQSLCRVTKSTSTWHKLIFMETVKLTHTQEVKRKG